MNWIDIPYNQFSYKKMPATSGVYRFYSTINNTELYVGKAKKLCNRLVAHVDFLKKLFNEFGDTLYVSYIITDNFVKVEKESILKFKPKYNFIYNHNNFNNCYDVGNMIIKALDGRTQRWLSFEVRIPEADLSKKMKGQIDFTPEELAKIEERLNFKIN